MIGLDTNVLVRVLVRDEREQAHRALARLRQDGLFVAKSVLLECSWVLERRYGFPSERTIPALRMLLGLPNLTVEDRPTVLRALEWWGAGLDFADALHLAAGPVERFVTFDAALIRGARALPDAPAVERA